MSRNYRDGEGRQPNKTVTNYYDNNLMCKTYVAIIQYQNCAITIVIVIEGETKVQCA